MAKIVSEFKVQYEDTCFSDYFQGVTVMDQNYWQGVSLGCGASEQEAGEDACETLAMDTGEDCEYVVPNAVWEAIEKAMSVLSTDTSDTDPEDEAQAEDWEDERPNVYVAIYYR